ncbi:MAG TPA: Holliday junction branch migration protein RuvA [Lachnospiraceae bacterium]|jgi:Holliday junction DNA helicase RuvA|nr:Holliday junction branch migration protein RuvA [Lachnospiraceae bacterium]
MFYSLKGILSHVEPGIAVVECGGVGFKCLVTLNTQRNLPKTGEEVFLYTHLNVREDALDLYGFSAMNELNCFKMLTSVSGVGPKVGLAILSELTPEQVAAAVATNDSKALTRASGVGKKLAQRISLELRDKVKGMEMAESGAAANGVVSASSNAGAAVNALTVLGYSPTEAASVVGKFDSSLPVEELIRMSLKEMGSNM